MKKILLLAIFCLAISGFSFGQLEVISADGTHGLNNGDTVVKFGDATDEMTVDLLLANNGLNTVTIGARRDSILLPMRDTDNDFCWAGFCYSTSTDVSPYSETLNGEDTTTSQNEFQGHYYPYGHLGAAYIRYDFYNASNPSAGDSAWVVVEYVATPTGIENIQHNSIHFAIPYPNPATSFVTIGYGFTSGVQSANLKIFNMLGECVRTLPLSAMQNTANLNVQNMPSGIYVCEIQAQGCSPVYQKLVVSH